MDFNKVVILYVSNSESEDISQFNAGKLPSGFIMNTDDERREHLTKLLGLDKIVKFYFNFDEDCIIIVSTESPELQRMRFVRLSRVTQNTSRLLSDFEEFTIKCLPERPN